MSGERIFQLDHFAVSQTLDTENVFAWDLVSLEIEKHFPETLWPSIKDLKSLLYTEYCDVTLVEGGRCIQFSHERKSNGGFSTILVPDKWCELVEADIHLQTAELIHTASIAQDYYYAILRKNFDWEKPRTSETKALFHKADYLQHIAVVYPDYYRESEYAQSVMAKAHSLRTAGQRETLQ